MEALPELESYVLTTGETGALAAEHREGGQMGPQYGRLSVELVDLVARDRSHTEVIADLRQRTAKYAGVTIEFVAIRGLTVDLHVSGADKSACRRIAERLRKMVCCDLLVVFS